MAPTDRRAGTHVPYLAIAIAFLALDVAVFALLFTISSRRSLDEAYDLAQETISFLEDTTDRYESVDTGDTAKSLESLTDTARALSQFLPPLKKSISTMSLQGNSYGPSTSAALSRSIAD